jgi:hypothetical protein
MRTHRSSDYVPDSTQGARVATFLPDHLADII